MLFTLPSLVDVSVSLQQVYLPQVKEAFKSKARLLPAVDSLRILSPDWMFLSEGYPNLRCLDLKISTGVSYWDIEGGMEIDITRLGKAHPNLEELHCSETGVGAHIKGV